MIGKLGGNGASFVALDERVIPRPCEGRAVSPSETMGFLFSCRKKKVQAARPQVRRTEVNEKSALTYNHPTTIKPDLV